MRIGHYCPGSQAPGGMASYLRAVLPAQRRLGHEVFCLDHADRVGGAPATTNLELLANESELAGRVASLGLDVLHLHAAIEGELPSGIPLVRTVHNHGPYCPSGTRYLAWPGRACPRRYSVAGCGWGHFAQHCGSVRPGPMFAGFARVRRELLTLPGLQSIAVSAFVRGEMLRSGYPAKGLHVVHPPAPDVVATGVSRPGRPTFVFAGRLTPEKGADWLLRAVALMRTEVSVEIAGIGPEEPGLRRLARTLGLDSRARFHGWLPAPALEELIEAARALVFPSLWPEPAGLAPLEAMARGRAVVASRCGGIPEIVEDGVTGVLVSPGSVEEMARALDRLASEPDLALSLGAAGQVRAAEHFSLERHLDAVLRVYVVAGADAAPRWALRSERSGSAR